MKLNAYALLQIILFNKINKEKILVMNIEQLVNKMAKSLTWDKERKNLWEKNKRIPIGFSEVNDCLQSIIKCYNCDGYDFIYTYYGAQDNIPMCEICQAYPCSKCYKKNSIAFHCDKCDKYYCKNHRNNHAHICNFNEDEDEEDDDEEEDNNEDEEDDDDE
jgi:hypothetical protein